MSLATKTEENNNVAEISSTQSSKPQSIEEAGSKAAFLATFTPQDDKVVMRKVDRRFLLLIGILYMTKNVGVTPFRSSAGCLLTTYQIDYLNASVVKVLQVGQDRNILTELNMTSNEYNWVQSIYFVSRNSPTIESSDANDQYLDRIHYFRGTKQHAAEENDAPTMAVPHNCLMGDRTRVPRRDTKPRHLLRIALSLGHDGSRSLSRPGCTTMLVVPQRRDEQTNHVDVRLAKLRWHLRLADRLWDLVHERPRRSQCMEVGVPSRGPCYGPAWCSCLVRASRLSQVAEVRRMVVSAGAGVSRGPTE